MTRSTHAGEPVARNGAQPGDILASGHRPRPRLPQFLEQRCARRRGGGVANVVRRLNTARKV